jgi:hypothetical protein
MSINPLDVIFKPLTMRGFWLGHPAIAGKIGPAIVQAAAMIVSGRVHVPVAATYPISSVKQAVAHAQRGRKNPSGRCRIIYLTSESSIRYGHHNQWDGHWEFPRGALPEGPRPGLVRGHMKLRRSGVRVNRESHILFSLKEMAELEDRKEHTSRTGSVAKTIAEAGRTG